MGMRGPKPELIDEEALLGYSEESYYWLGILATEGNICFGKGRSVPLIRYGAKDIEHVYKFRDFLGSKRKIQLVDRITDLGPCKYGVFAVSNLRLGEFLIKNGITPKKSLTLRVSCHLANSPSHWRGAIDGDGSVWFCPSGNGIKLYGCSFQFVEQFAQFCANWGLDPLVGLCRPSLGKKFGYSVAFGGTQGALLAELLYGAGGSSLDRKQINANKLIATLSPSVKRLRLLEKPGVVRLNDSIIEQNSEIFEDGGVIGPVNVVQ